MQKWPVYRPIIAVATETVFERDSSVTVTTTATTEEMNKTATELRHSAR